MVTMNLTSLSGHEVLKIPSPDDHMMFHRFVLTEYLQSSDRLTVLSFERWLDAKC